MTQKEIKQLNNLTPDELKNKLIDQPFNRIDSIMKLYNNIDNKDVFFDVCLRKMYCSSKITKRISKKQKLFLEVLKYCLDNNKDLSLFYNMGSYLSEHINLDKVIATLGYGELCPLKYESNNSIFIYMFNQLIDKDCKIDIKDLMVTTIKNFAFTDCWQLHYYSNTDQMHYSYYRPRFTLNFDNDVFIKYFDINDYKRNPKCLLLFLIQPNKLTEEQKMEILQYFKKTLLYKTTRINELPIDKLSEEQQKYIQSSIMVKKLNNS